MSVLFTNRAAAGSELGLRLAENQRLMEGHPVVIALGSQSVPIAAEVAKALDCPLDMLLLYPLGKRDSNGSPLGWVGGRNHPRPFLDHERLKKQDDMNETIQKVSDLAIGIKAEWDRLTRGRPPYKLINRPAILCVDGIEHCACDMIHAAFKALELENARWRVLAVPLGHSECIDGLTKHVDLMMCLHSLDEMGGVETYYETFNYVPDPTIIGHIKLGHRPDTYREVTS